MQTPDGSTVRAYDRERTICDLIRRRTNTDPAVFRQAIQSYARSKNKNLVRLSEYSKAMNIESRVREVMEVAL